MAGQPATECEFVRLLPDGTVVVRAGGEEWSIQIDGIEVPQPLSAEYLQIFDRIAAQGGPMRYTISAELGGGRHLARLSGYGWQDKSGDVWLDVGTLLVEEGAARLGR